MQLARGIASRLCPTPVPKLTARFRPESASGAGAPGGPVGGRVAVEAGPAPDGEPEASRQERDRGPCGDRRGPGPRWRRKESGRHQAGLERKIWKSSTYIEVVWSKPELAHPIR